MGTCCSDEKNDNETSLNNLDFFINDALFWHNEFRRKHCSPQLSHNPEISKISQRYAEELAAQDNPTYRKSNNEYKDSVLGENIFIQRFGHEWTGKNLTECWYNEINNYNFDVSESSRPSNNFTQLVWKDTREIGFGLAKNKNGDYIIIANYYPKGNITGEFIANVLKNI